MPDSLPCHQTMSRDMFMRYKMNRKLIIVVCGGLALWSTFRFDMKQFQLPDLQFYVNSTTVKEGQHQFPVNMSYTSWLSLHHPDRANITRVKSISTNPLLEFFPDFCGDW